MAGKHSGKDASSSKKHHSSSSKPKPKGSSSSHQHHHNHHHVTTWCDEYVQTHQTHELVAQGKASGRGDSAADMAQWDARWASASNQK
ncbi:uncharacterized protein PG998_005704 [Apiospora kogelbergensis]|uniref:Uncharacterized protein n=1 Tax=Apiospora kogelbergensis TaxID=1337665 RepID=A0AAW0R3A2_9PEZI